MSRHPQWRETRNRRRGQALHSIDRRLAQIAAHLAARGHPGDVQQAIEDIFNTYGQISQVREVLHQLVDVLREHDSDSKREREDIKDLTTQLISLMRKMVRSHEDLARAVGGGEGVWNGMERRGRG
jgi:hypothetical protein